MLSPDTKAHLISVSARSGPSHGHRRIDKFQWRFPRNTVSCWNGFKHLAPFVLGHRIQADLGYGYGHENNETISEMIEQVDVPVENWEI